MTAPAVIKQSELRRVVSMAKEANVTIELERDGMKIRVIPDADIQVGSIPKPKKPLVF